MTTLIVCLANSICVLTKLQIKSVNEVFDTSRSLTDIN